MVFNERLLAIKHFAAILFLTSNIFSASSSSSSSHCASSSSPSGTTEDSPLSLTRTYLSFFDAKDAKLDQIENADVGFRRIAALVNAIPAIYHRHVKSGCAFGLSFNNKNKAPIDVVVELLTGQKVWKKETIEGINGFGIADVGCGLGLSAINFISRTVDFYKTNGWSLKAPIQLDLFDITPEHNKALEALAKLVNTAYPKYFMVRAFVHDAATPLPNKNYRIVLALNLMHYVPEESWGSVLKNIEDATMQKGMLFLTVDNYKGHATTTGELSAFTQSASQTESPFCQATVLLFDGQLTPEKGTNLLNVSFTKVKKEAKGSTKQVPGGRYKFDEIDVDKFKTLVRRHMQIKVKKTIGLSQNGQQGKHEFSLEGILHLLEKERIVLQLSNYCFDENLLERAIFGTHKGSFKKLKFGWVNKLLKTSQGFETTVGITLIKE